MKRGRRKVLVMKEERRDLRISVFRLGREDWPRLGRSVLVIHWHVGEKRQRREEETEGDQDHGGGQVSQAYELLGYISKQWKLFYEGHYGRGRRKRRKICFSEILRSWRSCLGAECLADLDMELLQLTLGWVTILWYCETLWCFCFRKKKFTEHTTFVD